MSDSLRLDLLLDRLCITRSRSEAKAACDAGAVRSGERVLRASHPVRLRDRIEIHFPTRRLELEVLELPPKSTSRKAAREMYRVVDDGPIEE